MADGSPVIPKRVWFVVNRLEIVCALPADLSHGHFLRQATDDEITRFKGLAKSMGGIPPEEIYETRVVPMPVTGPGSAWKTESLAPGENRYYVIEPPQEAEISPEGFRHIDHLQHELDQACRLSRIEIEFPVTMFPNEGYQTRGYDWWSSIWSAHCYRPASVLDDVAVNEMREVFGDLLSVSKAFAQIKRASEKFLRLRRVGDSELYPLGLFAIIESLLTHEPHGGYDSLGHQIRSKIPLLENRMPAKLDYSCFTTKDSSQTWSKLYKYRSLIAHGGIADFTSAELKALKGASETKTFLDRAVKSIIRIAMKEPQLISDLQKV
jgi:hypothetical protein